MAVAWFRNPVLDERVELIDRDSINDRTFGRSRAARHPAYVYSIGGNACLMHKVAYVTIDWYALVDGGHRLGRLKQPAMVAHTVCGATRILLARRTRTCTVPEPGAVLCGRCRGDVATFKGHAKATRDGISRAEAHVRLGCIVNGYPSALAKDSGSVPHE